MPNIYTWRNSAGTGDSWQVPTNPNVAGNTKSGGIDNADMLIYNATKTRSRFYCISYEYVASESGSINFIPRVNNVSLKKWKRIC